LGSEQYCKWLPLDESIFAVTRRPPPCRIFSVILLSIASSFLSNSLYLHTLFFPKNFLPGSLLPPLSPNYGCMLSVSPGLRPSPLGPANALRTSLTYFSPILRCVVKKVFVYHEPLPRGFEQAAFRSSIFSLSNTPLPSKFLYVRFLPPQIRSVHAYRRPIFMQGIISFHWRSLS